MTEESQRKTQPSALSPHAAQLLAAEHWSLTASRSMLLNEAFSRVTIFLTILSASIVALALVADTSGFGDAFTWFAYALAPLVLFIGISTNVRLVKINLEDVLHVMAMNRLRRAYVDMVPELSTYFMAAWHDDLRGVLKTLMLARAKTVRDVTHFFVTTPTMLAIVNASLAAALAALIADRAGAGQGMLIAAAIVAFLAVAITLFRSQNLITKEIARLRPRFPSSEDDYSDELGRTD